MEPTVTSEERDALLSGWQESPARDRTAAGIRRYNFRAPDKFSKDQIRTIVTLQDTFARGATTALSTHLRAMVELRAESVEQMAYRQFMQAMPDPSILAVVSAAPLPGRMLWTLEPELAFFMIDRILGGPGVGTYRPRPLTDIETAVVRRIFGALLPAMREAWRNVENLSTRLEDVESQALFAQVAAPDDIVIVVKHAVETGSCTGTMHICIPFHVLEPVLPRLSVRGWLGQEQASGRADRLHLNRHVLDTPVVLRVELGRVRMSMGEFLALKKGDLLRLSASPEDTLQAYVAQTPAFRVRAGTRGRRMAVTIESVELEDGGEVDA